VQSLSSVCHAAFPPEMVSVQPHLQPGNWNYTVPLPSSPALLTFHRGSCRQIMQSLAPNPEYSGSQRLQTCLHLESSTSAWPTQQVQW
jgi:hypothetical protein